MLSLTVLRVGSAMAAARLLLGLTPYGDRSIAAAKVAAPQRTAAAATAPAALARWDGRYSYAFDGGRTVGGSAEIVTYTLTLAGGACRFEAEGYQTDESIVCIAKPGATTLDIAFKSYANGATTDRYGNAVYSVGDPLFALERHGAALRTHWKGYPLPDEKPRATGTYFVKR